ncbi:MAG: class I tRNA ligase family protein, partial [Candidatus Marinimicrobia bacterium]|nr:class I tRNA ligase family protein [Candidatus Neomarinimicrobiota bacterium]
EENKIGTRSINYKLRDWLFSRQRYWGEPIPLYKNEAGETFALNYDELPLTLPEVENYEPSGRGESPLANITDWAEFTNKAGEKCFRETHTMPQWAGSNWYYLRYIDPKNSKNLVDPEKEKYWMNVDFYIGGAEHAVLHLLYARFWHKVLYDFGVVSTKEPFQKLLNQGLILGEDGEKMSKSRGNVISPDSVIKEYGADSLRLYEMFMGPIERPKPWSMSGIGGIHRFLNRVWRLYIKEDVLNFGMSNKPASDFLTRSYHKTVKVVTEHIEQTRFNTAISQMMIFINDCYKEDSLNTEQMLGFIQLLSPYAPHLCEELWARMGQKDDINTHAWPEYDEAFIITNTFEYPVMFNGKMRFKITIDSDADISSVESAVRNHEHFDKYVDGKLVKMFKVIPGKIVTIALK